MKALFLRENGTFPPLDKRNMRDKAKRWPDYFGEAYRGVGRTIP